MTVYAETDFLIALVKDDDWLGDRAESALDEHEVVTSPYSYLELLIVRERYEYDYVQLVANMLELVPVESEEGNQVVLKAVDYYEDGMTPFDAFHAATAETRGHSILSSDKAYGEVDAERLSLEPEADE